MKNLRCLQYPNLQYTERQSPRMTMSRRTAELVISRVGNLHKIANSRLNQFQKANPQKWKRENWLALSITTNLIANEKHEERFIHTLAPFAVRAMVCINLSSRVSMTIPLTSKPPPELSPGGGCLRALGTLRSSKSKLHVTCPWIAQLMTVLCLDLPHIQQTANPNLEQKESDCLINNIKYY